MTIRHICVNAGGMVDSKAARKCVLDRFRSNKAPTVVSIVSQLTKLEMSEAEDIQNFFIRARERFSRLQRAGKQLSPTFFNAVILTGLPE